MDSNLIDYSNFKKGFASKKHQLTKKIRGDEEFCRSLIRFFRYFLGW